MVGALCLALISSLTRSCLYVLFRDGVWSEELRYWECGPGRFIPSGVSFSSASWLPWVTAVLCGDRLPCWFSLEPAGCALNLLKLTAK